MPSFFVSAMPKWDVNHGSQSLIILVGRPNHWYTCSRYSWVIPGPVIVVLHGGKTAALEHLWSIMVRIASMPHQGGKPVMRSIAMCWKGLVPALVRMRYKGVHFLCVRILLCWHTAHP